MNLIDKIFRRKTDFDLRLVEITKHTLEVRKVNRKTGEETAFQVPPNNIPLYLTDFIDENF